MNSLHRRKKQLPIFGFRVHQCMTQEGWWYSTRLFEDITNEAPTVKNAVCVLCDHLHNSRLDKEMLFCNALGSPHPLDDIHAHIECDSFKEANFE